MDSFSETDSIRDLFRRRLSLITGRPDRQVCDARFAGKWGGVCFVFTYNDMLCCRGQGVISATAHSPSKQGERQADGTALLSLSHLVRMPQLVNCISFSPKPARPQILPRLCSRTTRLPRSSTAAAMDASTSEQVGCETQVQPGDAIEFLMLIHNLKVRWRRRRGGGAGECA